LTFLSFLDLEGTAFFFQVIRLKVNVESLLSFMKNTAVGGWRLAVNDQKLAVSGYTNSSSHLSNTGVCKFLYFA